MHKYNFKECFIEISIEIYSVTPVKVQYSEKMDPDALYYDLTDKGLAVIFNHTQFYNNRLPKRLGTWNDVIRLEKCLKNLNFSCKMYDDCAIADIQKIMEIGN